MISKSWRENPMRIDMFPKAIDRRLRRVSELRDLCRSLSKSEKAWERPAHLRPRPRAAGSEKLGKAAPAGPGSDRGEPDCPGDQGPGRPHAPRRRPYPARAGIQRSRAGYLPGVQGRRKEGDQVPDRQEEKGNRHQLHQPPKPDRLSPPGAEGFGLITVN